MRKGKLGVTYSFYAVLAFVLLIFGQTLLGGLLLGLVILVERDEWTSRQCMQAFFFAMVYDLLLILQNGIFRGIGTVGVLFDMDISHKITYVESAVHFFVWVIFIVISVLGLVKVMNSKEANLPLVSKWAYKAYGYVQQAMPAQQTGTQMPYPSPQQQQPQQPYPGYPVQQQAQPPQPSVMPQQPAPAAPPMPPRPGTMPPPPSNSVNPAAPPPSTATAPPPPQTPPPAAPGGQNQ